MITASRMGASDPSNSHNLNGDGGVGLCMCACVYMCCMYVCVCVCACVCACVWVMCLQYSIIFDPEKIVSLYFIQITHTLMISPQWVHG